MYVRQDVIKKVISTFIDNPKLRDDRYGTIVTIFEGHYGNLMSSGNTMVIYKVMSDIDRCFRLIQQRIPSLRGETWEKRQKKGGRHTRSGDAQFTKTIEKIAVQLNFDF